MEVSKREIELSANLLSIKVPDWQDRVDLETLDMDSPTLGILGQVFTGDATMSGLAYAMRVVFPGESCCVMGFCSEDNRAAWVEIITEYRAAA